MNLTFKGFLRQYCRELLGCQTDNLRKLLSATIEYNPSAAEALMSFAAIQGKQLYLAELARGTYLYENYEKTAQDIAQLTLITYLSSPNTSERYKKVLNAYNGKKNEIEADRRIISLMREKTLKSMSANNITPYRVFTDLNLNKGNTYAYLHKGDVTKVSKNTARNIMEYVSGYAK